MARNLDPCPRAMVPPAGKGHGRQATGSVRVPADIGEPLAGMDEAVGGQPAASGRNRVLSGLPVDVRTRLQSGLERVEVRAKTTVGDGSTPLRQVYFPETGLVSLVVTLTDGATVQAAMIGYEGIAGLPGLPWSTAAPIRAIWQISGSAWTMELDDFTSEVARSRPFRERVQRYSQALYVQMAQSIACGRHHSIDARCARWLLCCSDRVGDEFDLTHESLAHLLGVRRPGVSVSTAGLQRAGLIRYQRGRMSIRDRSGLAASACECYGIVHAEFERLLGW